jgi:predicted O-methyltransferase YrrM
MTNDLFGKLKRLVRNAWAPAPGSLETGNLADLEPLQVAAWFRSPEIDQEWNGVAARLAEICPIKDGTTGGVNPGDRRALFYLVKTLRPASVLEIGSHVGASTAHIAAALIPQSRLTTVDLMDVNDGSDAYWRAYGLQKSPRQMLSEINRNLNISFVTSDSLSFLRTTDQRFDFIFLDGDHSMNTVLREIPAALRRLNKNGVIVLHDYFPNAKPLWSNANVISGPFNATEKLRAHGAALRVIPLSALPWATKLGSNVTSLAIVVRQR